MRSNRIHSNTPAAAFESTECSLAVAFSLEMPTPGWGPRHPPGTPPRGGVWGWGIEHTKPRGTGDFFEKSPGVFGGLFTGMMCGSK